MRLKLKIDLQMDITKIITAVMAKLVTSNPRTFAYVVIVLSTITAGITAGLTVPVCDGGACSTLIAVDSVLARIAPVITTITTVLAGLLTVKKN